MSGPQVIVTRSSLWSKLVSVLAIAVIAGGLASFVTGNDTMSSSLLTVDQIRNIARISTVEHHLSSFSWTALTKEALVVITQRVREADIECQTASRLQTVLTDFLAAFGVETEVVFEDNFDFAACANS